MKKRLFLILESFKFAYKSLRTNLLRTSLSLLGVTIGIFSIVAIYSSIDALNNKIMDSMSKFGQNTLYITKFSFGNQSAVPRWKRKNFPFPTINEYKKLKKVIPDDQVKAITFRIFMPATTVKVPGKTSVSGVELVADGADFPKIDRLDFQGGRFFNNLEDEQGKPVAVIGADIKDALFGNENPIGKSIRIYGKKVKIIGFLKKEGSSVGPSNDSRIFIPSSFARTILNPNRIFTAIIVAPKENTDMDKLTDFITMKLRKIRKLKPTEGNNFFVNNINTFRDEIEKMTKILKIGGSILALFSLLIGAFGIANIMFVSVKERTNQIGIQKALGSNNSFILWQFLFESVLLSLVGGIVGILLVVAGAKILTTQIDDFSMHVSIQNILLGLIISSIIGIIAGLLPAWKAAKLNPVEAIRTGM